MRRTVALLAALSCLVGGSTAVASPGGGAAVPSGIPAGGGAMPAGSSAPDAAEPVDPPAAGGAPPQATPAQADDSPSSPGADDGDDPDEPVLGGDEEVGIVVPLPDDRGDEPVPVAAPAPQADGGLPITGLDAIALALAGAALLLLGVAAHGATRGTSAWRRPRVAARARGRA